MGGDTRRGYHPVGRILVVWCFVLESLGALPVVAIGTLLVVGELKGRWLTRELYVSPRHQNQFHLHAETGVESSSALEYVGPRTKLPVSGGAKLDGYFFKSGG